MLASMQIRKRQAADLSVKLFKLASSADTEAISSRK